MNRTETIEAILNAAKEQPLKLVLRYELQGTDGKWYGSSFPRGVDHNGEKRPYWVQQMRDGTTIGKRFFSAGEGMAYQGVQQAKRTAEFRAVLDESTDAEVESQADYWLKRTPATV